MVIFFATYRTFILPYQVLDLLFIRYDNVDRIRTKSLPVSDRQKVKNSILIVIEEWTRKHPEDWTQIKNKKCRQIIRKTLAFCKRTRPESRQLEQCAKANLQLAKQIRQAEKADENKSLEMELNSAAEDIDRTSINGKAAEIFLNRITVKDIGNLNKGTQGCHLVATHKAPGRH